MIKKHQSVTTYKNSDRINIVARDTCILLCYVTAYAKQIGLPYSCSPVSLTYKARHKMHSNNNPEPTTLYFSLLRERWPTNGLYSSLISTKTEKNIEQPVIALHTMLFVQSGWLSIGDSELKSGSGAYIHPDTAATHKVANNSGQAANALRFVITNNAITTDKAPYVVKPTNNRPNDRQVQVEPLLCQAFNSNLQEAVLRLDQVDFPPGAIAYRHTHPGAGIRYLLDGGLQLESDHGKQYFQAGEAWFEDKNCPVKATAINSESSRFVRAMLLPPEYEDKPTLTLLNAEDANKPRLQTNTRHFEHRVSF